MMNYIRNKYDNLYAGVIYDAMKFDMKLNNFVIPKSAGPLVPAWNFKGHSFGRAYTAVGNKTPNPEEIVTRNMLDDFPSGSIYLLQANDNSRAHCGDITAKFLKRAGCEGAVIQGWTRDIELIEEDDLKLWCKGAQPQDSFDRWNISDYNCTIVIGNIFISPSDYIFADRDGIFVINEDIVEDVAGLAEERKQKEDEIRDLVLNTDKTATQIKKELGRW